MDNKKGIITDLFKLLKNIDQKDKKSYGKALKDLKKKVNVKIKSTSEKLNSQQKISNKNFDLTRPGFPFEIGSSHPISIVKNKIIDIFYISFEKIKVCSWNKKPFNKLGRS